MCLHAGWLWVHRTATLTIAVNHDSFDHSTVSTQRVKQLIIDAVTRTASAGRQCDVVHERQIVLFACHTRIAYSLFTRGCTANRGPFIGIVCACFTVLCARKTLLVQSENLGRPSWPVQSGGVVAFAALSTRRWWMRCRSCFEFFIGTFIYFFIRCIVADVHASNS